MEDKWTRLTRPPVIVAILQIKFEKKEEFDFNEFIKKEEQIRKKYPKKHIDYHSNIGVQGTPHVGVSIVKAKTDTKVNSVIFTSEDLSKKLVIEQDSIRYIFEGTYESWIQFKIECLSDLIFFDEQLKRCLIRRVSIRFVNKFNFETFDNPLDYFTTTISIESDSDINNPVVGYSFRVIQELPDTEIKTIINHSLEKTENAFDYFFDIDVLDHEAFEYNYDQLDNKLERIRDIKNSIFFGTLKEKTLQQCN